MGPRVASPRRAAEGLAPLLIDPVLPELVASLRREPRLVLEAPPGAGKTTRVPRALLDAGLLDAGDVVVLQPRRLAARLAAARVADELGEDVGETVGYQVRFDERASARTRIRFVTEGVLTRRLLRDPGLRGTSTVVLDEFHERHLEGDLALSLLLRLASSSRPDLRIVVMSATLDAEAVARHLGAPRLRSEGRMHEVTIEHAELEDDRPIEQRVLAALRRVLAHPSEGHVLVFLPGAAEIRRCLDLASELAERHELLLLPLHGELSPTDQDRAVRPSQQRKVIFSTNVAETSVTLDGVATVIDSGLHRRPSFSPWTGLPSLTLAKVSRASAAQRTGRAGRTRAGTCIRLYTRHDHDARPAFDAPEIRRSDLASLVLSLAAMGIRSAASLPWLEPPPSDALAQAAELLRRLGALGADSDTTDVGRRMLRYPLHPRLARLVVASEDADDPERGADLAAVLGERDLRARRSFDDTRRRSDASAAADTTESDVLLLADLVADARAADFDSRRLRDLGIDPGAARTVARTAEHIARIARSPTARSDTGSRTASEGTRDDPAAADPLRWILLAFPDRVARVRTRTAERRRGADLDVVLSDGSTAVLGRECSVRDDDLLVAVDAEERARSGGGAPSGASGAERSRRTVRLASAIEPEWLLELFPERVEDVEDVRWDAATERVVRTMRLTYGAIVLDESTPQGAPTEGESRVLAAAALAAGPRRFARDSDAFDRFVQRVRFASQLDRSIPALDDARLRDALESLCAGRRSFGELRDADLLDVVRDGLPAAARARVETLAPDRIALGSRQVRVHYEADRPPWIESRLQDFFGLKVAPSVGAATVPLVLHLLAPNGRAVQVTTDLPGFWARHYPGIRKELARRYPRHAWPEDPLAASPPGPRR
ncbi:MAG: ATP-dependent helicase HrpB [Deltaproteobacteria bacterium]|nr:ATP-dependent helicase HrpB [Deltaproteobacteria bacterium]